MTFRTVFSSPPADFKLNHTQQMLMMGSCFTEHIGRYLQTHKFQVLCNPFGIVYNPYSMAHALEALCAGNVDEFIGETFENQGVWNSWSFHSALGHPDRPTAEASMHTAFSTARAQLLQTDVLCLTLGTADVFSLLENGQIVANNHKMPAALFVQNRMSVQAIVDQYTRVFAQIQTFRPDLKIVLSVSPVRHLRQGMIENQRSKAVLSLVCEALCGQHPNVSYFPAYEILMDDLRDYRFYAADMVHPNAQAVEYIWEIFGALYFSETTRQLNQALEKLLAAVQHRPFHQNTPAHKAFARNQLTLIEQLEKGHPAIDFSIEKVYFQKFI